jgi:DNA-binding response OmpR family regulator
MTPKKKPSQILVIDDDEFLLVVIKKKLELTGYVVTLCNNVHEAYFQLNILKPDLIMLDIIMPDVNGIEFMAAINSRQGGDHRPVLLMSYLPKKELYHIGYNIGSALYLPKPFNVNKLPVLLKRILLKPLK